MKPRNLFLVTMMSATLMGCSLPPCPKTKFYPQSLPIATVGIYYSTTLHGEGFSTILFKDVLDKGRSNLSPKNLSRILENYPDQFYFNNYGLDYEETYDENGPIINISGIPTQTLEKEFTLMGTYHGRVCEFNHYSRLEQRYIFRILPE